MTIYILGIITLYFITIPILLLPFFRSLSFFFEGNIKYSTKKSLNNNYYFLGSSIVLLFAIIYIIISTMHDANNGEQIKVILNRTYIIYMLICIYPRIFPGFVNKKGLKTDNHFVKWFEISNIEKKEEGLLIYYTYNFLITKIQYTYIIRDCSDEISISIQKLWKKYSIKSNKLSFK